MSVFNKLINILQLCLCQSADKYKRTTKCKSVLNSKAEFIFFQLLYHIQIYFYSYSDFRRDSSKNCWSDIWNRKGWKRMGKWNNVEEGYSYFTVGNTWISTKMWRDSRRNKSWKAKQKQCMWRDSWSFLTPVINLDESIACRLADILAVFGFVPGRTKHVPNVQERTFYLKGAVNLGPSS